MDLDAIRQRAHTARIESKSLYAGTASAADVPWLLAELVRVQSENTQQRTEFENLWQMLEAAQDEKHDLHEQITQLREENEKLKETR